MNKIWILQILEDTIKYFYVRVCSDDDSLRKEDW
jgi:hypothetical protein